MILLLVRQHSFVTFTFPELIYSGTSLVKLGRAHCKVATLQEAYALTFQDTFITSCQNFAQHIKDYEHQRKKLESRRYGKLVIPSS